MRLEKVLSYSGIASRRKSKEIILSGLVKVNGKVCIEPGYKVNKSDVVTYQGEVLRKEPYVYFLVNKPRGVVSTTSDEKKKEKQ